MQALHWLTIVPLCVAVAAGLAAVSLAPDVGGRAELLSLHRAMAAFVVLMTLCRLACRLARGAPPPPAHLSRELRLAARATHVALYALLLLVPATGYMIFAFGGRSPEFFGVHFPVVVSPREDLVSLAKLAHRLTLYALYGLIALHVAAALWHQAVRRDDVLATMMPPMRTVVPALRRLGWTYMAAVASYLVYDDLFIIIDQGLEVWELTYPLTPGFLLVGAVGLAACFAPGTLLVALAGRMANRRRHEAGTLLRAGA